MWSDEVGIAYGSQGGVNGTATFERKLDVASHIREFRDAVLDKAVQADSDNVAKFKSGNEGVFKFFVGQVMKATRGQANPQAVNDILRKLLSQAK